MPRAHAAPVVWASDNFDYVATGGSVASVLDAFASLQHLRVVVDGEVPGAVDGRFSMAPARFLDTLGHTYGFVWYYNGVALRISPANAQQSVALRPHALAPDALVTALTRGGLTDAHFPLSIDAAAHTVNVTGPASYVERLGAAADRFERAANTRTPTSVRVFRLTRANAADDVRVVDGRTFIVPGAATLLRRRFQPPLPPVASGTPAPQLVDLGMPLPAIEADAATNSILVRDKPQRIEADEALVMDLDVMPQLVSIQTWVVDVDADALDALQAALPPALATASGDVVPGVGVAPDGGHALLAQLHALAAERRARIEVSQTSLTQDRSPAVIDRHEERLAREAEGRPDEPRRDLWLGVRPTVNGNAAAAMIGLGVEIGHPDDARQYRHVEGSVAAGECLVIEAPRDASAEPNAGSRLVLLVPRVVA
ncbi:type II/III secretion system family protein [Burkholderia sp. Ax-1724]|nr:type II/III secretion system family protein [Burkholderia sp. Ax-1724]NIF81727.1 type II/III secretion system family protein [Paraburkholderia sp. Cy-641]